MVSDWQELKPVFLISLVEALCRAWVTGVMLRHAICLQGLTDEHCAWNLLEKACLPGSYWPSWAGPITECILT